MQERLRQAESDNLRFAQEGGFGLVEAMQDINTLRGQLKSSQMSMQELMMEVWMLY